MIVVKKWVAAGSTATFLAGGLFLGAPMASAAPGDAACLTASTQFNAALSAAGIDVAFVGQLEAAAAAVVATTETAIAVAVAALVTDAAIAADAEVVRTEGELDAASDATLIAAEELAAAERDSLLPDPDTDPLVIQAQQKLLDTQELEFAAGLEYETALAAYEAAVFTPEVQLAEQAALDAAAEAELLIGQLNGDPALAEEILALFKQFLAACDASAIGVDPVVPVVVVPTPVTPVGPATPAAPVVPVTPVTPAAPVTPEAAAPTGTNKGLNVQTAVETQDNSSAVALIAALLAVGVAVPAATAARMRRLERAQR